MSRIIPVTDERKRARALELERRLKAADISEGKKFVDSALNALSLGYITTKSQERYPEAYRLSPSTVAGGIVGGLPAVLLAGASGGSSLLGQMVAFGTLGAIHNAESGKERALNIIGGAGAGAAFKLTHGLSLPKRMAALGGYGGSESVVKQAALTDKVDPAEALVSTGVMAGLGAVGKLGRKGRKAKPPQMRITEPTRMLPQVAGPEGRGLVPLVSRRRGLPAPEAAEFGEPIITQPPHQRMLPESRIKGLLTHQQGKLRGRAPVDWVIDESGVARRYDPQEAQGMKGTAFQTLFPKGVTNNEPRGEGAPRLLDLLEQRQERRPYKVRDSRRFLPEDVRAEYKPPRRIAPEGLYAFQQGKSSARQAATEPAPGLVESPQLQPEEVENVTKLQKITRVQGRRKLVQKIPAQQVPRVSPELPVPSGRSAVEGTGTIAVEGAVRPAEETGATPKVAPATEVKAPVPTTAKSRPGSITTPDKADLAAIGEFIKSPARRLEVFREMDTDIRKALLKAKIGAKSFFQYVNDYVDGKLKGVSDAIRELIVRGYSWLHENGKLNRKRPGFLRVPDNETKYTVDTTGDVVVGDEIKFTEGVFGGSFKKPKYLGDRTIIAKVIKDSYGKEKQQHSFTLEILDSEGVQPLEKGIKTSRKGRNVYRNGTLRRPWENEKLRGIVAEEKHTRGDEAREAREERRNSNDPFRSGYIAIPNKTDLAEIRRFVTEPARRVEVWREMNRDFDNALRNAKLGAKTFFSHLQNYVKGTLKNVSDSVRELVARGYNWLKEHGKLQTRPGFARIPGKPKEPLKSQQRGIGKTQVRSDVSDKEINLLAREEFGAKRGAAEIKREQVKDFKQTMKTYRDRPLSGGIGRGNPLHEEFKKVMFHPEEGLKFTSHFYKKLLRSENLKRFRDATPEQAERILNRAKTARREIAEQRLLREDPIEQRIRRAVGEGMEFGKAVRSVFVATTTRLRNLGSAGTEMAELAMKGARYSQHMADVADKLVLDVMRKHKLLGLRGTISTMGGMKGKTLRWFADYGGEYFENEGRMSIPEGVDKAIVADFRKAIAQEFENYFQKGIKAGITKEEWRIKEIGYFPHWVTKDVKVAFKTGEGKLYAAIKEATKIEGGWGQNGNPTFEAYVNAEAVRENLFSFEFQRKAKFPWRVIIDGQEVKVLESDPLKVWSHYNRGAAQRLGVLEAFGGKGNVQESVNVIADQIRKESNARGRNGDKDMRFALDVYNALRGVEPGELDFVGAKQFEAISNLVTAQQLSLAAIPNLVAGNIPAWTRTDTRAWLEAMSDFISKGSDYQRLMDLAAINARAFSGMYDLAGMHGATGKIARGYLQILGFEAANQYLNITNALMGVKYFGRMAATGNRKALRQLTDEFGLTQSEVDGMVERGYLNDSDFYTIGRRMKALTNVTGELVADRQPWINKPFAQHMLRYTSYIRTLGRTLGYAVEEAKLNKNYAPLAKQLFGTVAGAEATIWLKNWLLDKERKEKGFTERFFVDMMWGGTLGMLGEPMQIVYYSAKYDENPALRMVGPSAGGMGEMFNDLAREALKDDSNWIKPLRKNNAIIDLILQRTGEER